MSLTMPAERRALERPLEITPRNSSTESLEDDFGVEPKPVLLRSDLGLAAQREVESSEKPLDLQSEIGLSDVQSEKPLPSLKLSSPLAHEALAWVATENKSAAEELEALHEVLQTAGISGLRAAVKALELRKLHRVLVEEGLPGLRAATRTAAAVGKAKGLGKAKADARADASHKKKRVDAAPVRVARGLAF